MKITAYCCLVASSLLVLAWPPVFFVSGFLFDAPTRDAVYEFRRYTSFFGALTYPWGLVVALIRILVLKPKGRSGGPNLQFCLQLAPIVQLGLAFLMTN